MQPLRPWTALSAAVIRICDLLHKSRFFLIFAEKSLKLHTAGSPPETSPCGPLREQLPKIAIPSAASTLLRCGLFDRRVLKKTRVKNQPHCFGGGFFSQDSSHIAFSTHKPRSPAHSRFPLPLPPPRLLRDGTHNPKTSAAVAAVRRAAEQV